MIDTEDAFGYTALCWAARRDDHKAVKLLLQHHANPYGNGHNRGPPPILAVEGRSIRSLSLLLDYGVDINRQDKWDHTPLFELASKSADLNMLELILQHKPDLNLRGQDGDSALLAAVEGENYGIATRLIHAGADINIKENSGYNALSVAILWNAHPLIQLLLERQADHHGTIKQHGTVLHLIAEVADIETLRILTNSSLATRDIQAKRSDGKTAVEVARGRQGTIEWQNAFYAFIWSVDETKTRVSPFGRGPQLQAEDSDGEGDVFHDAQE